MLMAVIRVNDRRLAQLALRIRGRCLSSRDSYVEVLGPLIVCREIQWQGFQWIGSE